MFAKRVTDDELEAGIFDFDGTIFDSMPVYYIGLEEAGAKWGLEITEEQFFGLEECCFFCILKGLGFRV